MVWNKYKKSRILNINGNIIIASLLSTVIAAWPVYWTRLYTNNLIAITFLSFGFDAVIDFSIFALLHYFVNMEFKPHHVGKDLLHIQKQRIFLMTLYFFLSTGIQYTMMSFGFERTYSFFWAYVLPLFFTRTIHTIYGLRTGLFEETKKTRQNSVKAKL